MLKYLIRIVVAGLLLVPILPAHHSVSMYNLETFVTIKGTVSKVEWTNPHVFIYVVAKNEAGGTDEWAVELDSISLLRRYGWLKETVKVGDLITCTGGQAKTGAKVMRGTMVELANGQQLKVWSRV